MSCFRCDARHPDEIPARFDPDVGAALRREYIQYETRRQFFGRVARGLGGAALSSLLGSSLLRAGEAAFKLPLAPHFAPRAKQAIFLVMGGGPSQLDMWDHKPGLQFNTDLPA